MPRQLRLSLTAPAYAQPPEHEIAEVVVLVVCRCGDVFSGLSEGRAFDKWCRHIEECGA